MQRTLHLLLVECGINSGNTLKKRKMYVNPANNNVIYVVNVIRCNEGCLGIMNDLFLNPTVLVYLKKPF